LQLWHNTLPNGITLTEGTEVFYKIAKNYDLTGAQIVSAMTYACLQTIEEGLKEIKTIHILKGIELEYLKEERFFSNSSTLST